MLIGGCLLLFLLAHKAHSVPNDTSSAASTTPLLPPRPLEEVDGIAFEVSSTTAEQEQGLGDRANVPDNYAMLFAFPQDNQYGFWMKDMLVPLDMVWLTDDGDIASITPDVAPDTYPTVFYPPEPIRYVLETKAGFAAEKGWKPATHIELPLPYDE
ncbi:MAG: DUF192 domain-containing protein [Candidatus Pacebacteria bacterium]|nr:DUF192 domain-containing protein [Candidatus Paceibacterota bacterium]